MSQQAIAQPIDCSQTCTPGGAISTPGPQGSAGADGTNGTNGIDAFTLTADGAGVMPAEGGSVTLNTTTSTAFLGVGQLVYVTTWGYMQVTIVPTSTSVTLKNVEDTGTGAYPDNAAPGTALSAGQKISPAGIQGPTGAAPSTPYFAIANNLSEGDPPTMRTNLGLDTAATKATGVSNGQLAPNDGNLTSGRVVVSTVNGISTPPAATARADLGLGNAALATIGVANGQVPTVDTTFTNGNPLFATASGVQTKTAAAARTALGVLGGYGLLGSLIGQSTAATGDFTITPPVAKYRIDKVVLSNPNISLGTAQFAVYTGAGGTGTPIALPQSIAGLATATNFIDLVLEAIAGTDYFTASPLYIRCTTSQAAGTCDIHVFGWDLT